jgi:hypothetical protein
VGHANHAVRGLVELASDRTAAVELRQPGVRHESDDLSLRYGPPDRTEGALEELVGLAHVDVLVEVHLREAREDDQAGVRLLDLSIQHIQ